MVSGGSLIQFPGFSPRGSATAPYLILFNLFTLQPMASHILRTARYLPDVIVTEYQLLDCSPACLLNA